MVPRLREVDAEFCRRVFAGVNLTIDLLPGCHVARGVPDLSLLPELAGDVGVSLILKVIVRSSHFIYEANVIIELECFQ